MQCVTPQIILLVIVDPSGWNEGLITSTVRVMHAKWWQITLFWVWLEVLFSLRRHSVCPTLSVSSLCVTSSPCPTSSTCPQSACLCVFVSLLLLFFCSLCPSPCSSVVRALLYVLVGVFLFSQLVWRSATSHIRRELVVSRLNWSARSDQLFTNRQTTCIATPGCHVAGAMWWNALPMHFPWQQRVVFF